MTGANGEHVRRLIAGLLEAADGDSAELRKAFDLLGPQARARLAGIMVRELEPPATAPDERLAHPEVERLAQTMDLFASGIKATLRITPADAARIAALLRTLSGSGADAGECQKCGSDSCRGVKIVHLCEHCAGSGATPKALSECIAVEVSRHMEGKVIPQGDSGEVASGAAHRTPSEEAVKAADKAGDAHRQSRPNPWTWIDNLRIMIAAAYEVDAPAAPVREDAPSTALSEGCAKRLREAIQYFDLDSELAVRIGGDFDYDLTVADLREIDAALLSSDAPAQPNVATELAERTKDRCRDCGEALVRSEWKGLSDGNEMCAASNRKRQHRPMGYNGFGPALGGDAPREPAPAVPAPECFRRVGPASANTYADGIQAAAGAMKKLGRPFVQLHVDDALDIARLLHEAV